MTVGEKIKALRKSLGLTQTELGQRVGVQKNAVSKWECGRVEDIEIKEVGGYFFNNHIFNFICKNWYIIFFKTFLIFISF